MVCGYGVDAAIGNGASESVTVGRAFDCWIAFDTAAEHRVLFVAEGEILRAGFGGDQFALRFAGLKELKLVGGRDMEQMKTVVIFMRFFNDSARRFVAYVVVAYHRMEVNRQLFAIAVDDCLTALPEDVFIFSMDRNQSRHFSHDAPDCIGGVNEHVSGR